MYESIRADEANPHYFRTYIQKQVVEDEISLLQLGQSDQEMYERIDVQ